MNNCPFCNVEAAPSLAEPMLVGPKPAGPESAGKEPGDGKGKAGLVRRAWHSVQWLFPATLLVLIPKCTLCVAAYVGLFTGIGISVSTAQSIQNLTVIFCLSSLGYLGVRLGRRRWPCVFGRA